MQKELSICGGLIVPVPGQLLDKQVAVYPAIAGPKFQIIFLRDRTPLDLGTHAVGDQPIDIFIDLLDLLHRGDLQFCDIRGASSGSSSTVADVPEVEEQPVSNTSNKKVQSSLPVFSPSLGFRPFTHAR